MGQFIYGSGLTSVEIDDRALAHLKVVIIQKLRRSEGFAFSWDEGVGKGGGRSTVWLHPSMAIQFRFSGNRPATLNRDWLESLAASANSAGGLHILPEPATTDANAVPTVY